MRLHTMRIPCKDLGESAKFYSSLLGQQATFGSSDLGYIGFAIENATLLLEYVEPGDFESGRYLGFSLEVDDIESFYNRHTQNVNFTGPPKEQVWGGVMTHVVDCDGNTFSIVEMRADA